MVNELPAAFEEFGRDLKHPSCKPSYARRGYFSN
jgi:hypothetical protein